MIIVQLNGGLGNQLFQYAAGLSLAAHHNVKLKVDVALLKTGDSIGNIRNYELKHLLNPPEIATLDEINAIKYSSRIVNYFQKLFPPYQRKIYKEVSFNFDKNFFLAGKNIYLKGYRQSELYFKSISDEIKSRFRFVDQLSDSKKHFAAEIIKQESVSIHIRRGDYTAQGTLDYHGMLSLDYYQKAIEVVLNYNANCVFYVFSNDISWVQSNLNTNVELTFVSEKITTSPIEDFYLMSCCRHNIIANSSFSWWAAWLNNFDKKIVIAPKKWFNKSNHDTSDLFPPEWILIN